MDGFWEVDAQGYLLDANEAYSRMSGYTRQELLRMKISDLEAREDQAQILSHMSAVFESGTDRFETLHRRKDGNLFHVEVSIQAKQSVEGHLFAFLRDITDRKFAEHTLLESEAKFRTLGNSAPDALILMNDQGLVEYWNPAAERIFGYSASEMQGVNVHSTIMPEAFGTRFESAFRKFRKTGMGEAIGRVIELTAKKKDGTEFPVELALNPISVKGSYWSSAIVRDISERKRAEEERTLNSRRLAALLELNQMSSASVNDLTHFALEEAVKLTGSSIGYIAFANEDESVLTMYAWSRAAMKQCAIENKPIVYPVSSTGLWGEAIRQRRPIITNDYSADTFWKKGLPSGHVSICRHMNVPIFDGGRIVIVAGVGNKPDCYDEGDVRQLTLLMEGMWRIVTKRRADEERKNLQEQLAQASKMEAIGRLAGGVAHDFNNMLGVIRGHTEIALEEMDPKQPLYSDLKEILKATNRSIELTRQLLAFARKQTIAPKLLNLNETIAGMLNMLQRMIGENIQLKCQASGNLWPVKADPSQIDQILANLCLNARDAIQDFGEITIELENCGVDADYCSTRKGLIPGEYVRLAVKDTGCGIDKEMLETIFEPFFTTKKVGQGTGLGLSMVYGAVRQNDGFIYVDSEPGIGTTFLIFFPRQEASPEFKTAITNPHRQGNETILVVEDEPGILTLTTRLLKRLGHNVVAAERPADALRLAREHEGEIHLLITDVIMPEMNGRLLAENVKSIFPNIKCLFMSGYTADIVASQGILDKDIRFIQKPFSAIELAHKLEEVLG